LLTCAEPQVAEILSNERLSERYLSLARDLDVSEAKLPEDVYKMHLVDTHRAGAAAAPALESGMKNLSDSLVNALLNLGFGADKLVTVERKEGEKAWVSRNKNHGKTCAVASIGVRFATVRLPVMSRAVTRAQSRRSGC
jgi:26S proteasome regulatory subunit N1